MTDKPIMATTPEAINAWRLLSLKGALKLEIAGIKFKGPSRYGIIKKEFGLKGTRQQVYDQFVKILQDKGILP